MDLSFVLIRDCASSRGSKITICSVKEQHWVTDLLHSYEYKGIDRCQKMIVLIVHFILFPFHLPSTKVACWLYKSLNLSFNLNPFKMRGLSQLLLVAAATTGLLTNVAGRTISLTGGERE